MEKISDQEYLTKEQYRTAANLEARIAIHLKYSSNPYGWNRWVMDQLAMEEGMTVLEIGCGTGSLWVENRQRLPDIQLVLADLSPGMAQQARTRLAEFSGCQAVVMDAQMIAVESGWAQRVIANHMLFHVPDIGRALREIRRVLKPGGLFFAATNGLQHLKEMITLIEAEHPGQAGNTSAARFGLENAADHLQPVFPDFEIREYFDSLWITEIEPLEAYIRSNCYQLTEEQLQRVLEKAGAEIAAFGGFRVAKSAGLICARG